MSQKNSFGEFLKQVKRGEITLSPTLQDRPTPTTTVEQPELAVQPASQSSTSGLKNFYDQAMKGVGAVTSLANPWNAITTMSKLLPTSVSNEIERGQQRFINSALLGLPQQVEKKITGQTPEYAQTRSWKDDKLGSALDFASTGAGYFVPGLGWIKGLSATGRLGKLLLAGKVPKLAKGATTGQKIARTAKVAGQQAKEGAIAGAGLMGAEVGIREALNPQDYNWKQNTLDILLSGATSGAVIDPLAYGVIRGAGRLFKRGQTPPTQPTTTIRQRPIEEIDKEWRQALNEVSNRGMRGREDVPKYLIQQKGWTKDDLANYYSEEQAVDFIDKFGTKQPTPTPTPTIGNATRLKRGQTPTGASVVARSSKQQKSLDDIIDKPPETQQTLDQILNDLTPEINLRLDPPLTNKANLAKWLKKYALPNESLSKIQKRPAEELRQLAIETRKNLDTRETAIEIAKEKNIDLDALFKQADAENNINAQTLDNIINPQPRVETETPSPNQDLVDKAMQYLTDTGAVDLPRVQQELRLDYNSAAKLMEELNNRGINTFGGISSRNMSVNKNQQPKTQQPVPKREVISTGTSTGEVFRQGDNVYKPTTYSKTGYQTLEAEVYSELEGAEGIAKGRKVTLEDGKDYIETPFYKKVISVDTIPKDKRQSYASSIKGEVNRIIKAIEELSNKGYYYSDPLQFGVNKDGDLDLMDFSNASKKENLEEAIRDNYSLLSSFLRTFGLEKQADVISKAMRYKGMARYTLDDIEQGMTLFRSAEKDIIRQIKRGGEFNANNVYYATNAREVQVKGIGQTEPIDGIKYIYSETPLSPKVIDEWELTKVYEQPKAPAQKSSKDVSKTNKETQLDIINKTNPAPNNTFTWIRTVDDIKDYREIFSLENFEGVSPDVTKAMARDIIGTGLVKIYSSKPIKNGVFVTPSKMEAEAYAGGGKIYEKTVKAEDVAWIDEVEGQYAELPKTKQTPKKSTEKPTVNKESLDNIINPQAKTEQPTTTTKDLESDEYLFSEQRRIDISEKVKKQFDRSIKDYEDAMKNAVDPRAREAGAKFAKGQRMAQAAAIREEIQGDLLIPIEGGLTGKELNAKLEYLRSNYEGKEVIVDGREGVIEKTVFGNTIIKFKDGSRASYDYETLQKSNFQPKVDIEEVIRQQTDRKAIYDLETEAKQLKLTDRAINTLDNLEQQMRDFLKDSKNRLSSNPVDQYAAYAGIMAVKILKGTIKAADFTAELVKEFGEEVRPYASQILQKTSQIIKQQLNNAPASQQTPSPITIPVSQSLPNPPSTVPAAQQKPSRITATVSKRLRKKGSVNVVSNLVNNTNNTTPAAITPVQYNKLNSFDHHTRDVYRNLQHALGQQTADKYLNMLDDAKKENLDMQQFWLKWLEDEVIKKYNIRRGRESSKLVQMFGEQKITLAELQQRAPKDWQNIVNADKAFRFAYDTLIDEVNATRLQIHGLDVKIKDINQDPNLTAAEKKQQVDDIVNQATNEGKLVPKRSDYYRHFKDNGALYSYKNIYDTVSKIGDLTEEFKNMTNSKILTSFVSFAKKRMGNKTKYDAVAGFLDYIPAASYAVKIDPMIKPFRELGDFIRQDAQTRNIDVGNLADYLNEFADDLANVRQSQLDKSVSGIESFKLTLSAAHLITNMVKRNLLVGNIGTVLVQGSNLANAFGYTKQYALVGMYKTFNDFFNKSARLSDQSTYLRERGFAKEYRRLDDRILMQPLNFANWLMETADMTTAKIIWNSAYAQGKAKKVADPMRYADDIARKSTAGRGVGEMPFINKGKLFNIVAPFQYDVANTLQVYRDIGITKKDVMGLASLMVAAYVSNEILKAIRGSGGQLDLINAFKEASKKDLTPVQRGGRVLGELFSNIPLGQTVAAFDGIFPKYGGERDILGFKVDMPSREKLFGSADPTRFGEDMLFFNAFKQPQYFVLPPFGGAQIRKTQEAITALAKGKSEEDKQTRFLLDNSNAWKNLQTVLFGIYTSPEGRRYLKEDQRMLSVEQSKMLDSLPKEQQKLAFEYMQFDRRTGTITSKITSTANDTTKTVEQKKKEISKLNDEYIKVSNDFQKFVAEQNKK